MERALDPITRRYITPESHALRKAHHGLNALCGACGAEAFDHSVGSLKIMPHFNHVADSGPCRLKGQEIVKDVSDYSGDGERLRREFFQEDYIQLAFAVCQNMVCGALRGPRFVKGNFTVPRFIQLLHIADTKRTWNLKGLTVKLVPFLLVANEVFDIKYREDSEKGASFTFALRKTPLVPDEPRRYDRNITVDSTRPVLLEKRFVKADGTAGTLVTKLDPDNPYIVSEEDCLRIAGTNWSRLPAPHISAILSKFTR